MQQQQQQPEHESSYKILIDKNEFNARPERGARTKNLLSGGFGKPPGVTNFNNLRSRPTGNDRPYGLGHDPSGLGARPYNPSGLAQSHNPTALGQGHNPPGYSRPGLGQPYNPPGLGQGYNPTGLGQAYNPSGLGGQGYNPSGLSQGYNPSGLGQGYNPSGLGQGYNPYGLGRGDNLYGLGGRTDSKNQRRHHRRHRRRHHSPSSSSSSSSSSSESVDNFLHPSISKSRSRSTRKSRNPYDISDSDSDSNSSTYSSKFKGLNALQKKLVLKTIREYCPENMQNVVYEDLMAQMEILDKKGYKLPKGYDKHKHDISENEIKLYEQQLQRDKGRDQKKMHHMINFTAYSLSWFCQFISMDWIKTRHLPKLIREALDNGEFDDSIEGIGQYLRGSVFDNPMFSSVLKFVEKVGEAHHMGVEEEQEGLEEREEKKEIRKSAALNSLNKFRQAKVEKPVVVENTHRPAFSDVPLPSGQAEKKKMT